VKFLSALCRAEYLQIYYIMPRADFQDFYFNNKNHAIVAWLNRGFADERKVNKK
jgi:hypothetical protein